MSRMRTISDLISILVRTGLRRDRYWIMRKAVSEWKFMFANNLPTAYLVDLWPEIGETQARLQATAKHHFELPYGERLIIASLVAHLQPRTIFEFGTFTGETTRLMADAAPTNARIHTIDLPSDEIAFEDWIGPAIGSAFSGLREYDGRIESHRCSTRKFDFGPYRSRIDLVFIDASHDYDDVLQDSAVAMEIISPTGVIVWDDYQPGVNGVVRALNEIARSVQLVRIAHSRLVVFRPGGFPGIGPVNPTPWQGFPDRFAVPAAAAR